MHYRHILLCIFYFPLLLASFYCGAQTIDNATVVEITFNKTSSIIFASAITSVDRGSRDILAQKAKGVENVLQLKASRRDFPETNLTVITAEGKIHQIKVTYAKEPASLVTDLDDHPKTASLRKTSLFFSSSLTEPEMNRYARRIIKAKPSVRFKSNRRNKMQLTLKSVHARDNLMYFHFTVSNGSVIPFDTDYLRFYIQDKSNVKRTASQQVQLTPVMNYGNDKRFVGGTDTDLVYALDKFTIPDAKKLVIQVMEKNGGRHLTLRISNRTLVNARPLN